MSSSQNAASALPSSASRTNDSREPPLHTSNIELPDEPLVKIRASRKWVPINFRDLWAYRDLLYVLAKRDVQVRYKQTILGAAWAIIQPLFLMIIFTLFFGKLAGIKSDGVPYPVFAYAGLLPWTFFSTAVSNSGNSLIGSANLITKVYFPRMIVPGAAVVSGLIDFIIAFVILIGMMIYYGIGISAKILLLPYLVLLLILLALGVGMWMAALNVNYRDIRYALPFLIQIWMFATPVIYPTSMIPDKWRWLMALNPLVGIVENFRACIFNQPLNSYTLLLSTGITVVTLVYAMFVFRRMERGFADVV